MTMTLNDNQVFATSDLGLAASLLSVGNLLVRVEKANPRKAYFVFNQSPELSNFVERYWSRDLEVDALSHFENTKLLKNRLYEGL